MKKLSEWVKVGALALLSSSFASGIQANPAASMPLLPPGTHLGFMVAYESLTGDLADKVNEQVAVARTKGLKVGRVMVDWADLEPVSGRYEPDELRDALADNAELGLKSFVTIGVLDSDGLVVPDFLRDPDDETRLKNGMDFDHPAFIRTFNKLLERVVPIVVENGGFALAVSNEPQFYLKDHRGGDVSSLAAFVSAARDKVHTIEPKLAVTVVNFVVTGNPPVSENRLVMPLVEVSDVAAFNYVPFEGDVTDEVEEMKVGNVKGVIADFKQLSDAARGKQVIIQEFHAPSGYADRPSHINMNPVKQKRLFERAIEALKQYQGIRVLYLASLVDWSPQLTGIFAGPLREEGLPGEYVDQFEEWYTTMGAIWYPSGKIKPAWREFLHGLETLNQ